MFDRHEVYPDHRWFPKLARPQKMQLVLSVKEKRWAVRRPFSMFCPCFVLLLFSRAHQLRSAPPKMTVFTGLAARPTILNVNYVLPSEKKKLFRKFSAKLL